MFEELRDHITTDAEAIDTPKGRRKTRRLIAETLRGARSAYIMGHGADQDLKHEIDDWESVIDYLHDLDALDKQLSIPTAPEAQTIIAAKDAEDYKPDWLVENWMPLNHTTLLTGPGGFGKSFAALQLASAIASGAGPHFLSEMNPLGSEGLEQHVIYASYEDGIKEVSNRFYRISEVFEWADYDTISKNFTFFNFKERGPIWGPEEGVHRNTRFGMLQAGDQLLETARDAQLLIIDPLSGAFQGNEIVRAEVYEFLSTLNAFCEQNECAILLIAHPPKNASKDPEHDGTSGSTAWRGGVRSIWNLSLTETENENIKGALNKESSKKRYALHQSKTNYGVPQPPIFLRKQRGVLVACTEPEAIEDYDNKFELKEHHGGYSSNGHHTNGKYREERVNYG